MVLVVASLLIMQFVKAQHTADIGLWGGLGTYSGDMTMVQTSSSLAPAAGVFIRYNFNPRYSVRGTLMIGGCKATGEFESSPWEFSKTVTDFSGMFEFNFWKYMIGSKKNSITTYLIGGLGVSFYPYTFDPFELNRVGAFILPADVQQYPNGYRQKLAAMNMPFGFGFKFNIGARWGVGLESQFRKYFDDRLDNLNDPRASYDQTTGVVTEYNSSLHNNDWTYHLGVHVCYRFYQGGKKCPAYDNIN